MISSLIRRPGHDGLAGAGVVGKQEPQRLTREHFTIDGSDLVRQRVDPRAVDGEVGVEQVREPDALGLGGDPERLAVAIEAEGSGGLDQFEPRLGIAKEQHLGRAVGAAVDHVQGIGADPLGAHDLDRRRTGQAPHLCPRNDLVQRKHRKSGSIPWNRGTTRTCAAVVHITR